MKAKTYAVTVQYGGGFHNFPFDAYADTESEAIARAVRLNADLQRHYDSRTGRRGVRPRVMVWKQIEVPRDEVPSVDTSAQVAATPSDTSISQQVDNLAVDLAAGHSMILQRLPLGALEGDV